MPPRHRVPPSSPFSPRLVGRAQAFRERLAAAVVGDPDEVAVFGAPIAPQGPHDVAEQRDVPIASLP